MTLGQRLKKARERRELTQDELAAQATVKKDQVSRWENDTPVRDMDALDRIATVLGVTFDWLYGRVDEDRPMTNALRQLIASSKRYFITPLTDAEQEWCIDFLRSHGDVSVDEWIARVNGKRRGLGDSDILAEERETRAAQETGNALGVPHRT